MRALLLVLDSVGVGHAADAAKYGDEGANTLGHILARMPALQLPNLYSLGLAEIVAGVDDPGRRDHRSRLQHERASFGKMQERSAGKDTTTGHWEIAGVILDEPFAIYERFPAELVHAIERRRQRPFHRQLRSQRHNHSRRIGPRTLPYRPAHSLHLGRFGLANRRARRRRSDRAPL